MTNQATVRSTGTSIGTNTSTNTCTCALENASIVRTLFDLFFRRGALILVGLSVLLSSVPLKRPNKALDIVSWMSGTFDKETDKGDLALINPLTVRLLAFPI